MAREIVRRLRHRAHLSDDEIIVLDDTWNAILDILDRGEVVQAVSSYVGASKSSSARETQRAGRIHAGRLIL